MADNLFDVTKLIDIPSMGLTFVMENSFPECYSRVGLWFPVVKVTAVNGIKTTFNKRISVTHATR